MKYLFVFLTIVVIWAVIILVAAGVYPHEGLELFLTAQILTVGLVYIGFYRK